MPDNKPQNSVSTDVLNQCRQAIQHCLIRDRFFFKRELRQIEQLQKQSKSADIKLQKLVSRMESSQKTVAARDQNLSIEYPEALPVSERREEIAKAITENQVVVIAGETGSGKTTQIPKICLELGFGRYGTIAHTQPRRLAARSVAQRIAEELNVDLGETIGYQVRFKDQSSKQSRVKLMTDGILLAQIQQDKFLNQFDVIIIDEAHERSLNIDFLLGYLKQLLPKRPDLKIIITSATIDVERFSKHFENAPIIEVSGRTYPVEIRYRGLLQANSQEDGEDSSPQDVLNVQEGIVSALQELADEDRKNNQVGDVLIFLPGERDIHECADFLRKAQLKKELSNSEVLPLFARLSSAEQNKIFSPHAQRRIILSTNVAETSLTVPGIRYVIDTGTARISRYSYRSKVQRLPIEAISQASANQRAGRCGRVSEGICIRLYEEEDFLSRTEFTDPEIQRTNLASVILQMSNLGLGDIQKFPFVDAPDNRFIRDGVSLLQELEAVDHKGKITRLGKTMARLPLEPRISRMLVEAEKRDVLADVLIVASALSVADVKERPLDKQQQADQKHAEFRHPESDFLTQLNLWHEYERQRQELSNNQTRKWCKKYFISYLRMREWRDIYSQILQLCRDVGFETKSIKTNYIGQLNIASTEKLESKEKELTNKEQQQKQASYQQIHSSILSGLLSHIAMKHEGREYLGARNRKLHIFPGSGVSKTRPKWIMAAELVETNQLYARVVAKIEPQWVMDIAQPLLKRQYFEAFWSEKRGQVLAYEQSSLYGLIVNPKRIIDYSKVDLPASREIFLQQGLVEQQNDLALSFYKENLKLIEDVNTLEDKTRRRDFLIEDHVLADFYQQVIPQEVCSIRDLTAWYKKASKPEQNALILTKDFLLKKSADSVTDTSYPAQITMDGLVLPLSYCFAPNTENDGVTIHVPAVVLAQISEAAIEWLVPGFLHDKVIALIKGLPKAQRKLFVPVPDTANEFLSQAQRFKGSLHQQLAVFLSKLSYTKAERVSLTQDDFKDIQLDKHFLMNIEVTDGHEVLGQGRNLQQLKSSFEGHAQGQIAEVADDGFERSEIARWDLSEFPEVIEKDLNGIGIKMFPALYDEGSSIRLGLESDQAQAYYHSERGIVRLLRLSLAGLDKDLRKEVKRLDASMVYYQDLSKQLPKEEFYQQLIDVVYHSVFLSGTNVLPRTEDEFKQLLEKRSQLHPHLVEVIEWVKNILPLRHKILKELKGKMNIQLAMTYSDIKAQLEELFNSEFLKLTPWDYLKRYKFYLDGIVYRLDKLGGQAARDRANLIEWQDLRDKFEKASAKSAVPYYQVPELLEYRYLLEELRLSLFAQVIKTSEPVSVKKMKQKWLQIEQNS